MAGVLGGCVRSGSWETEVGGGRLRWRLVCYPGGRRREGRGAVSLYLRLHAGLRPGAVLKGRFVLSLLDAAGREKVRGVASNPLLWRDGDEYGWPLFVARERLERQRQNLLQDDCLVLHCRLAGLTLLPDGPRRTPVLAPPKEDLTKLLFAAEFTDVTLVVGPRRGRVSAHRAILAARSPALAQVLGRGSDEQSQLALPSASITLVRAILASLYKGRVTEQLEGRIRELFADAQVERRADKAEGFAGRLRPASHFHLLSPISPPPSPPPDLLLAPAPLPAPPAPDPRLLLSPFGKPPLALETRCDEVYGQPEKGSGGADLIDLGGAWDEDADRSMGDPMEDRALLILSPQAQPSPTTRPTSFANPYFSL